MIASIGSSSYSLQDMESVRQNRFKKTDADGDGKITKDELSAVVPQNGKGPSVDDIFSKVDTDGDGSISDSEDKVAFEEMGKNRPPGGGPPDASKMASDLFKLVDTDTDGKITKDELTQVLSESNSDLKVDDLLKSLDADEDGSITESELTEGLQAAFEQMQTNQPPPPPTERPQYAADRARRRPDAPRLRLALRAQALSVLPAAPQFPAELACSPPKSAASPILLFFFGFFPHLGEMGVKLQVSLRII